LADLADVPALAKSYLSTKEMVGKKGIILPVEGDEADIARFRTEIGVPDTVDGYDMSGFKPPEGLPWSDGFQKAMLTRLHARGIPNGQIQALFDDYAEVSNDEYQGLVGAATKGHEQATLALKTELGADYEASAALAQRAFKAAAGDQFEELSHVVLPDGTNLGDNPAFVRTFMNVGKQLSEHGLLGGKDSGGSYALTPESAKAEIAILEKNPGLYNEDDPEHKLLVDKKNTLYEMAYPETQVEVL